VSGLEYGSRWPALPGTVAEAAALAATVPSPPVTLSKAEATAARLAAELPRAHWAHIATHGEFKADELAAEKRRALDARKDWREGSGSPPPRDVRNPLAYVGLVVSGGEVMSGLSILDLNLTKLKLVTLSACETGLGEYTVGKGVENLQTTFHVAGAENVVTSLWNVNDAATAALMAKFYHELWVNKKPPIEALREAQLTVYHNPALIPDLAGERGAPKLKEAVKVAGNATVNRGKVADTKLWAAFVLSGVGR
jgi:CHAT domain-containing protein